MDHKEALKTKASEQEEEIGLLPGNNAKEVFSLNECLEIAGQSRLQLTSVIVVCLATLSPTVQSYIMYMLTLDRAWKCAPHATHGACNFTGVVSMDNTELYKTRCKMNRSDWEYVVSSENSFVTAFDLSCDRENWIYSIIMYESIGYALGCLVQGYLADRYGRQRLFAYSSLLTIALPLLSLLSPYVELFALLRALTLFASAGTYRIGFILVTENAVERLQPLTGFMVWVFYSLGQVVLGVTAKYLKNWRQLTIVMSAPFLLFALPLFFIPKFMGWLLSQGREQELRRTIDRHQNCNKKKTKIDIDSVEFSFAKKTKPTSVKDVLLLMFLSCKVAGYTLTLIFGWFSVNLIYGGISLVSDVITKHTYRNFIILGLIETPAAILPMFLSRWFSMKSMTWVTIFLSGVFLTILGFIIKDDDMLVLRMILAISVKFLATLGFDTIFLWSLNLYPTKIGSAALGNFAMASNIGSMVTPWVAIWLQNIDLAYPFFVMGAVPACAALLMASIVAKKRDFTESSSKEQLNKSLC